MKPKQAAPLLLLALIWGIYYVASHKSVEQMSVFTVGIVIRLLTMVLLTAVMLWKRELPSLLRVKGVAVRLLLIGLMGFLLDLTAFVGLSLSPAARAPPCSRRTSSSSTSSASSSISRSSPAGSGSTPL